MSEHLRIVRGSPTEQEARAIERAIETIRQAERAATAGPDPWVLAARREATRSGRLPRDLGAWRRSGRLGETSPTDIHIGRGDAR